MVTVEMIKTEIKKLAPAWVDIAEGAIARDDDNIVVPIRAHPIFGIPGWQTPKPTENPGKFVVGTIIVNGWRSAEAASL